MSEQQGNFDLAELTKMYDFKGKTVAITGGSGVLGSDIVYALVGCGADVAILDIVSELHPATIGAHGRARETDFPFQVRRARPREYLKDGRRRDEAPGQAGLPDQRRGRQ